jgi:phenylpyruvate tautomerase PptA (4-oxalocrotonate tautomerase family)
MPLVEITLLEMPAESKERIAKAITEILAEEEKKVYKVDTTAITVVAFRELAMEDIYLGGNPLPKVIETLPKA